MELKYKELELKNKSIIDNEKIRDMENEIKLKDQMIEFIKANQNQQIPQQIQPQLKIPFNHETYLKEKRQDSYSWDYFKSNMLYDADFNNCYMKKWTNPSGKYDKMPKKVKDSNYMTTIKYIGQIQASCINSDNSINIMKSVGNNHTNSPDKFMLNIICKTMSNIPEDKRPLYCSNIRDKKFFYKNDKNEWVKADDSIFEKIELKAQHSYLKAISNTKNVIHLIYKDHYDMLNYADFQSGNSQDEQDLMLIILAEVKAANFVEKMKTALAKICKRDSDKYLIDDTIDISIKKDEFETDEEEQQDEADLYN